MSALDEKVRSFSFARIKADLGLLMEKEVPLIKFVDPVKLEILPPNEVGELAIKAPALSPEYFKRAEETRNLYLEDGFLLTGDLGMYDEDGFVYYKGRTKEIIKVSGYTVSPREIEPLVGS